MAYQTEGNKPDPNDPSNESSDYCAMKDAWCLIDDICAGIAAIRDKGTHYLPKFIKEGGLAYRFRLEMAPWRPEFTDALRNLCAKPFTRMVQVNDDAPDEIQGTLDEKTKRRQGGFIDDIDGRGNSLHVFARDTFVNGVKRGLGAIYVTFPKVEGVRTQADEKAIRARPYWVQIDAPNIIALSTRNVNGREVVDHIRFRECTVERDRFAEVHVDRIRVVELDANNVPTSQSWIKGSDDKYTPEDDPKPLTGVSEIPIALFFTGERSGSYRVKPPLIDLAYMQIELYRSLSNEEQIVVYAGSPMLKMKGLRPPQASPQVAVGQVPFNAESTTFGVFTDAPAPEQEVGPGTIIYLPPDGGTNPDADYIQPVADNIRVIGERIAKHTEDFRRLALQPTTSNSGNLTATGASIEGAKAHSSVEVWANGLKAALDQALKYTAEWMNIADTVTATVHTDFGVDLGAQWELDALQKAKDSGTISEELHFNELQRRNVISQDQDWEEDQARKAEEDAALAAEQPIIPRTGKLANPTGGAPAAPPPPFTPRKAAA